MEIPCLDPEEKFAENILGGGVKKTETEDDKEKNDEVGLKQFRIGNLIYKISMTG